MVIDRQRSLRERNNTCLRKLDNERPLVYLLQKSRTQCVVDLHSSPNHLVSKVSVHQPSFTNKHFVKFFIPHIRVHPCKSVVQKFPCHVIKYSQSTGSSTSIAKTGS